MKPKNPASRRYDNVILVLQGGGALGAYQAGVFEGMTEAGYTPNWVTGVSIGAINAALIAGNPSGNRVARLREFWELVSSGLPLDASVLSDPLRAAFNQVSAALSAAAGVPGFYAPRVPPAALVPHGHPSALSVYDTHPLERTLERLVDFDLINANNIRLSLGAVNVRSGNSTYFDSRNVRIEPRHVMASGALPPAFAPVEIDGDYYWDGGIVSNTPLWYVLDDVPRLGGLIVQVDLFSARGDLPQDLGQVLERHKDILYSSKTRSNTTRVTELERMKGALRRVLAKIPGDLRGDADVKTLQAICDCPHVDIVHLINRRFSHASFSKDYEFSRATIRQRWEAGLEDFRRTVTHPEWRKAADPAEDIGVYDLTRESPGKARKTPG
jgi:NTE family protein